MNDIEREREIIRVHRLQREAQLKMSKRRRFIISIAAVVL